MADALLIVLCDTVNGADDDSELLQWIFNKHFPDVLNSRRYTGATFYRRTDVETLPGVPVPNQRFVAVYQVQAADEVDLDDAAEGLREALAAGITDLSPTLSFGSMTSMYLLPITDAAAV